LTKLAVAKVTRMHDQLDSSQVYVVGDTPHDIEAARAAGAVSFGVASGRFSKDELSAAGADHALGSLEDPFPGA
jgi:phosphoglycolate phosphatase